MGNRVDTPTVARFYGECRASSFFGEGEFIALFEAECVHAQNIRVTRRIIIPMSKYTTDAIAKISCVADKEIR